VLEVGCGTGQLTNYLGVAHRKIFGADMTLNSLKLANEFKVQNGLDRVGFCQMNMYRPVFKESSFDLVICNGVLCAAADPYAGFQSISRLVKKNGYILIGTYNKYGRLITDLRRVLIKTFGSRFNFLDPHLRSDSVGTRKKKAWLEDQYNHPFESKHTMAQVLGWFESEGFEFMYGIPSPKAFQPFRDRDAIFEPHPRGNWLDHLLVQGQLALKGSYEGGFFTMIGKRTS
jgi:SAM-dependent methyltransferase